MASEQSDALLFEDRDPTASSASTCPRWACPFGMLALLLLGLFTRVIAFPVAEQPEPRNSERDVSPAARHADQCETLRVLQWNIWQEGTEVADGLDKIATVVLRSEADVVTLAEVRNYKGDFLVRLVAALAARGQQFYHRSTGLNAELISRWPISRAKPLPGGAISAYHLVSPAGREIVVAAAHLDYTHYQVYLPRGYEANSPFMKMRSGPVTDLAAIYAMETASNRTVQINNFLQFAEDNNMLPIILAGDFNDASHLDWTAATSHLYDHNGVVLDHLYPSSALAAAGFQDTWRELYPDPVKFPGMTWPSDAERHSCTSWAKDVDERDRIDFIYYRAATLRPRKACLVGSPWYWVRCQLQASNAEVEPYILSHTPWPSDHKGVLSDFTFCSTSETFTNASTNNTTYPSTFLH